MAHTGREVGIAAAVTGAGLPALAWLGRNGWPGEPSGCIEAGDCYCEAFTQGLIRQPANTLSNLAFIAVGLWVLAQLDRRGELPAGGPAITRLYGWIAIGLGVGSMLFHGAMTEWGGWADLVSMYLFITFFLAYEVRTWLGRSAGWMVGAWVVVNGGLAVFQWMADNGIGKFVFGGLVVATLIANRRAVTRVVRDQRLFWAGLGTYAAGNVIWALSRTGAPLCEPASLLQGHALWHVTGALAVGFFFLYLRSDRTRELRSNRAQTAGT